VLGASQQDDGVVLLKNSGLRVALAGEYEISFSMLGRRIRDLLGYPLRQKRGEQLLLRSAWDREDAAIRASSREYYCAGRSPLK
jgi:hypothetical protein